MRFLVFIQNVANMSTRPKRPEVKLDLRKTLLPLAAHAKLRYCRSFGSAVITFVDAARNYFTATSNIGRPTFRR